LLQVSDRVDTAMGESTVAMSILRTQNKRWSVYIWVVVGALITLGAAIGTMHIVPIGLESGDAIAFVFFAQNRGTYSSPDGRSRITVYTADAGAAHSGAFWSWVVRRHWYGAQVVAAGYLEKSRGPVPFKWTGSGTAIVTFVKGRHDHDPAPRSIKVK